MRRRVDCRLRRAHSLRPHCELFEARRLLTTYIVQNTGDSGAGTLRQAIVDANSNPGTDSIVFHIPASTAPLIDVPVSGFDPQTQTWTIAPLSPLPAITEAVTLDGYSQAHAPVPFRYPSTVAQVIALTGGPTGGSFTLTTSSPLPVITTDPIPWDANAAQVLAALAAKLGGGNVFVSGGPAFPDTTITVSFIGDYADLSVPALTPTNALTGGTNPSVLVTRTANGDPKFITSAANTVAAKSGNDSHVRIILDGSASGGTGITIAAPNVNVRGLAIGGFDIGVWVLPGATGARIQGNAIGGFFVYPVDAATGDPLPAPANVAFVSNGNTAQGVILGATNAALGGTAPAENNIIVNSGSQGVWIPAGAPGNQVFGNQIGVAGPSINGRYAQVGNGAAGVLVESSSNALGGAGGAGNIISANVSHGVSLLGAEAIRNRVENNFIGAPPGGDYVFGTGDPGNRGDGVRIEVASDNRVGGTIDALRNVIVGNGVSNPVPDPNKPGAGVRITGGVAATRNVVLGNFIGLTAGGTSVLGNALEGVIIDGPSNTVGPRNVVSGNLRGVVLFGANAKNNLIVDSFIGTDAAGTADLGNAHEGVLISGAGNNTVRGNAAGSQVISGNDVGVALTGAGATANLIAGNFIGTDATGTQDLGNSQQGVLIEGAPSNTVGGTTATAKNVISANHWGVVIAGATGNVLQGNNIGTTADGTDRASNEVDGVLILAGASNNAIGGTAAGAANVIAFNANDGVRIEDNSNRNAILSNSIFQNGALGIDLVDPGSNNQQPAPVLTSVISAINGTTITGTLTAAPNTTYRVQFFASQALNSSGNAEGQQFLGQTFVTTDASGFASFSAFVANVVSQGRIVSATATDPAGNTSEFSPGLSELAGVLSFSTTDYTVLEDSAFATITVVRSGGAGGTVTVAYATANGSGFAGVDYVATSGFLTFAPGVTQQTFQVQILANPLSSADKTVFLSLSDPAGGATLGMPNSATLTLINTQGPGVFAFNTAAYDVREDAGFADITVVRTDGSATDATVVFSTSDGTAVAGVDYVPVTQALHFGMGVTTQTVRVPVLFNLSSQSDKTVILTLSSPTGDTSLGTPSSAILNILNVTSPHVTNVRAVPGPRGTSNIVIRFDQPLIESRAVDLRNYGFSLRTAGRDHRINTRDDVLVGIGKIVYNAATRTVTLTTVKPIPGGRKILVIINGATNNPNANVGVANLQGTLLDGNNDGRPGGVFRELILATQTPRGPQAARKALRLRASSVL